MANQFVERARYPKGKRRLQAIFDATHEIVINHGLAAASQEAIAKRANLTQSSIRYYFPTKDELIIAFFSAGIDRVRDRMRIVIEEEGGDPTVQLLETAALHYDRVLEERDVYFFEAAAFWGRNPEFMQIRDDWYQSLDQHYAKLVSKIHPNWPKARCAATSFQIITLVLGSWVTMGSSRPVQHQRSAVSLKRMLLEGIKRLISAEC